ncbi:tyrosinase family protein [Nostoc sp. UHCC 0702]|nr:tyrosinase family protein [Nostoc sp. UHCC 0702]
MKKFLITLMLAIFTIMGTLLLPGIAYAQSSQLTQPTPSTPSTPLSKRYRIPKTPTTAVYTRYNIDTPEGKKALQSMEKAFTILRKAGCENPSSWYYQGAVHWVPTLSNFATQNTVCQKYTQAAYDDPQQKAEVEKLIAAWQHCTHLKKDQNPPPHSRVTDQFLLHFLPWHRLYIGYLEKIVRKLSGDQNFAIPYWEYTDPYQTTIAKDFVTSGSSLYTDLRNKDLNQKDGQVGSEKQQEIEKNKKKAYRSTLFNQLSDLDNVGNFTRQINGSPHGEMHTYIGGNVGQAYNPIWQGPSSSGLMTDVITAGFDPIFWVHHSTIDRYWESWTQATKIKATPQDLPLPKELAPLYTFADEKGIEHQFNSSEEIINAVYNVDYKYDQLDPDSQTIKRRLRTVTGIGTSPTVTVVGAKKNGDSLDEFTKITVPLTQPLEAIEALPDTSVRSDSEPAQPNISAKAPLAEGQYVLGVRVSFTKRPIGNYSVYLNLPHTKTVSEIIGDIENYYIGAANFFDAHSGDGGTKTFAFDVTDELNAQWSQLEKGTVEDFDVYFVSDNPSQTNDIKVESLTLRRLA